MKKILFVTLVILCFSTIYAQDVKISTGKLSIDGLLWLQYINTQTHSFEPFFFIYDTITVNSFTRRAAFLGLTATLNSWASGRFYFDIADIDGKPAYDLYATVKPIPEFAITFGQFKLPLGNEILTKSQNREFIEYSLIGRTLRAPAGTRDIGIQATYQYPYADLYLACVNGNGRNVLQDNDNKCLAGRVIIKPLQKPNVFIGANYYFGKYDNRGEIEFVRFGAEINYTVNPIIIKAELLSTKDDVRTGIGYYAQVGYNWMWLQPMFRYSAFEYESYDRQNELVFGLNFRPLSDNFKVMLNYKIEKAYIVESETEQKGLLAQVQFAF